MPATTTATSPLWPRLAAAGIAAFVVASLCLHGLRPDLDPVRDQMSLYLIGRWGTLLQAGYVALSIAMLALAAGLYRALPRTARSVAPSLLLGLSAVCLSVTACAHMDKAGDDRSLHGLVHGISAQGAFLFATTGLVLQAMRLRLDPRWRRAAAWLLPWALACFAGVWIGRAGSRVIGPNATIVGGIVLIVIGAKVLVDHRAFG